MWTAKATTHSCTCAGYPFKRIAAFCDSCSPWRCVLYANEVCSCSTKIFRTSLKLFSLLGVELYYIHRYSKSYTNMD
uniref:Uncharacterized protein n=1 Tax=Trichogramma kaykai TaxID=54128 RepID=A0ABD2WQJ3_9HYME